MTSAKLIGGFAALVLATTSAGAIAGTLFGCGLQIGSIVFLGWVALCGWHFGAEGAQSYTRSNARGTRSF